jgi:hypothetical protein
MNSEQIPAFSLIDNEKYPIIYIDRVWEDEIYEKVLNELIWLQESPIQKNPISSGGAQFFDAYKDEYSDIKNNSSFFLKQIYSDNARHLSNITKALKVLTKSIFYNEGVATHWYFRDFHAQPFEHSELISYYDNEQEYSAHIDEGRFTLLVWLCKEPQKFSGGQLYLPEIGRTVDFKPNTGIIIPSGVWHQVLPVKLEQTDQPFSGRFAIASFIYPVAPEIPEQNQ